MHTKQLYSVYKRLNEAVRYYLLLVMILLRWLTFDILISTSNLPWLQYFNQLHHMVTEVQTLRTHCLIYQKYSMPDARLLTIGADSLL